MGWGGSAREAKGDWGRGREEETKRLREEEREGKELKRHVTIA